MDISRKGKLGKTTFMLAGLQNGSKKNVTAPYTNEEWVELLSEPVDNQAAEELRKILIRGLKPALSKYVDGELDQFVEHLAQDGLLNILDNVHAFRGQTKFTTWAMKIAVREALTILRRKKWGNISINNLKGPNLDSDSGEISTDIFATRDPDPEMTKAQKMRLKKVQHIIENILTEKQQKAINAVMIHKIPLSIVADQMDTNRNNLYKLIYDARKKLSDELEVRGIDSEEILNVSPELSRDEDFG